MIETFSPFLLLQSMLERTPQNQKKIKKKELPTYISGRMLKPVNNQYVKTSEIYKLRVHFFGGESENHMDSSLSMKLKIWEMITCHDCECSAK